jgi:hypothetical protein
MARRQCLEQRDHGLSGDLLGLEMDHFAIRPAQWAIDVDVDPAVVAFSVRA